MARLRRRKLSPPCRSNASIVRGVDSRGDVTATGAIDSGAVIHKNRQIPLQGTLVLRVETSVSRLSIERLQADAKRLRAVVRPANRLRASPNLATALLKFPVKASDSCAIRNAILCRLRRIFLSLLKLSVASRCATGCGFMVRPGAAAVAPNWSSCLRSMEKSRQNIKGYARLKN